MKNPIARTKQFVIDHRSTLSAAAVAIPTGVLLGFYLPMKVANIEITPEQWQQLLDDENLSLAAKLPFRQLIQVRPAL